MIPTSQTVRFDCEVESNPASSIYWVKDGEQLYINGRIKLKPGNTLVVSHTVTSDSGIYQCVASNPAGVNTTAARLQVNVSSKCIKFVIHSIYFLNVLFDLLRKFIISNMLNDVLYISY